MLLETSVRTGGDYGLTTTVSDINQAVVVGASKVTIWGVPANPAHNPWRGTCERQAWPGEGRLSKRLVLVCVKAKTNSKARFIGARTKNRNTEGLPESTGGECTTSAPEAPLLTNPTRVGRRVRRR